MSSEFQENLAIDTEGNPLIVQCPVPECTDLDLWTQECAPGYTWVVVCGAGHLAFIMRSRT